MRCGFQEGRQVMRSWLKRGQPTSICQFQNLYGVSVAAVCSGLSDAAKPQNGLRLANDKTVTRQWAQIGVCSYMHAEHGRAGGIAYAPVCTVRVTSVVPQSYWPPESMSSMLSVVTVRQVPSAAR